MKRGPTYWIWTGVGVLIMVGIGYAIYRHFSRGPSGYYKGGGSSTGSCPPGYNCHRGSSGDMIANPVNQSGEFPWHEIYPGSAPGIG